MFSSRCNSMSLLVMPLGCRLAALHRQLSMRLLNNSRCLSTTSSGHKKDTDQSSVNDQFGKPPITERIERNMFDLVKRYEDVIGLTAIKTAQENALHMERQFIVAQENRREKQEDLKRVQTRLKEIHAELDKTSRGEDRYLHLLTEEHSEIKNERAIMNEVQKLEKNERFKFQALSSFLRESHERERAYAERTKYWSLIGSLIGALIGIIGATINNRLRMKELRKIVTDSAEGSAMLKPALEEINDIVNVQQMQIRTFMSELRAMLGGQAVVRPNAIMWDNRVTTADTVDQQEAVIDAIKQQEAKLQHEMDELKRMVAANMGYAEKDANTLVYVGPEISGLLAETASDLESKLKFQTLVAVVALYTALALTIPLAFALTR